MIGALLLPGFQHVHQRYLAGMERLLTGKWEGIESILMVQ